MAKKKGKGGAKAAANAESSSPSAPSPEVDNSAPATAEASDAPSPEPSTPDVAPSCETQEETAKTSADVAGDDSAVEELRRELETCKRQIAELRALNSSLAQENERLKTGQAAGVTATGDTSRQADMATLTQRIAALKKEQDEADAARETAWNQLKSVVADIARLAAPDAVLKAGTPTAATAAAFGAA